MFIFKQNFHKNQFEILFKISNITPGCGVGSQRFTKEIPKNAFDLTSPCSRTTLINYRKGEGKLYPI